MMTPEERAEQIMQEVGVAPESGYRFSHEDLGALIATIIRVAAEEERQACAAIAEKEAEYWGRGGSRDAVCAGIAELIRARGETT